MNRIQIYEYENLKPLIPTYALVGNVDLVLIRLEDDQNVSVMYGR